MPSPSPSWEAFADQLPDLPPVTTPRARGTYNKSELSASEKRTNPKPVTFASESERYDWERNQYRWYRDKLDNWLNADEVWTWGPPAPPWARLFRHEEAVPAMKMANAAGYWPAGHALDRVLGLRATEETRGIVNSLADRHPQFIDAIVIWPNLVYAGRVKHSRFYNLDRIAGLFRLVLREEGTISLDCPGYRWQRRRLPALPGQIRVWKRACERIERAARAL